MSATAKCRYCSALTEKTCSLGVLAQVRVSQGDLKVGDTLHIRWQDRVNKTRFGVPGKYGCSKSEILAIHRNPGGIVIRVASGQELLVKPSARLKVDRLVPCGTPCCEAHRQEPDDNVVYCATHWRTASAPAVAAGGAQ